MSGEKTCDCDYWHSEHRWHCSTNYDTPTSEPSEVAETTAGERRLCGPCRRGQTHVCDGNEYLRCDNAAEPDAGEVALREVIQQTAERYLRDFDTVMNVRSEARDLAVAIDRAVLASPWLAAHVSAAETKARTEALREAWLIVHSSRFDHKDDDGTVGGPDNFYNGVRHVAALLSDQIAASIARGDAR